MSFKKLFRIYCKNHMKYINSLYVQTADCLKITANVIYNYHRTLNTSNTYVTTEWIHCRCISHSQPIDIRLLLDK
jgi:hypothetical protein